MILLPLIWAGIISFAIIMYVLLDGFDLGIGILFPFVENNHQRDIMITTIAPVWDGNETWLVFGAASLYGAFPIAYSTLLPLLYMPIMIMLAALIFRGVAFEFRFKALKSRYVWDIAFCGGSTIAAFCQGMILGTFVIGYVSGDSPTTISANAWFTPFSIMTGCGVVVGYALLGSTWLIAKTTDDLQSLMYFIAKVLLIGIAFFMAVVSLWTPLQVPFIWERWFTLPNFYLLMPLPLISLLVFLYAGWSLHKRYEYTPFISSLAIFILAYGGFCISDYPYIIPHHLSLWDAAAPPSSQLFLLVGTLILLPILIGYTAYAYRVFWGKVTEVEHY